MSENTNIVSKEEQEERRVLTTLIKMIQFTANEETADESEHFISTGSDFLDGRHDGRIFFAREILNEIEDLCQEMGSSIYVKPKVEPVLKELGG